VRVPYRENDVSAHQLDGRMDADFAQRPQPLPGNEPLLPVYPSESLQAVMKQGEKVSYSGPKSDVCVCRRGTICPFKALRACTWLRTCKVCKSAVRGHKDNINLRIRPEREAHRDRGGRNPLTKAPRK